MTRCAIDKPSLELYIYYTNIQESQSILNSKLSLLILLQPGLILIDYGHFQYNSTSLGLALWAIAAVVTNYPLLGAVAFSLALNYKQMELYHALPFFFYLLGKSFQEQGLQDRSSSKRTVSLPRGVLSVVKIGTVVLLTFSVLWLPFYHARGVDGVLQVFRRLFPFDRGLYEDKVANFWCSISVLVKVRRIFSRTTLVLFSTFMTLIAALPSSVYLMWHPRAYNFLLALVRIFISKNTCYSGAGVKYTQVKMTLSVLSVNSTDRCSMWCSCIAIVVYLHKSDCSSRSTVFGSIL